jgi:hypothetical protein
MPSGLKEVVRRGFGQLVSYPPDAQQQLIAEATKSLEGGHAPDLAALAARLGRSASEVGDALSALTIAIIGMSSAERTATQLTDELVEAELFDGPQDAAVALAERIVQDRPAVQTSLKRGETARAVLPSLVDVETTVDIRLAFDKERVVDAIPVVVVHIDTDAVHEELWFQMTKLQVEHLITDLQHVLKLVAEAERISALGRPK